MFLSTNFGITMLYNYFGDLRFTRSRWFNMSTHHFNFPFFQKARFQLQDGVNTMSTFCAYKLID